MTNAIGIIDLTVEPKDYLTTLPSELQHEILGYLFTSHDPDAAAKFDFTSFFGTPVKELNPLEAIAATCTTLRAGTYSWVRTWLISHKSITHFDESAAKTTTATKNFLSGCNGFLDWLAKHCVFCGHPSVRSAILMNGLRCCLNCDLEHWPGKITKADAKAKYDLTDHQLLPYKHACGKLLTQHPGGMPVLRYGMQVIDKVLTTMFLEKDVIELARLAHGDLKAHFEEREAAREERRREVEADKASKQALETQLASELAKYGHGAWYAAEQFVGMQCCTAKAGWFEEYLDELEYVKKCSEGPVQEQEPAVPTHEGMAEEIEEMFKEVEEATKRKQAGGLFEEEMRSMFPKSGVSGVGGLWGMYGLA